MKYDRKHALWLLLMWMAALAIAFMLEGCRSTERAVTAPEHHYHVAHQHDTLILRDTVRQETTTVVREVDSTTMAQYGIQLQTAQRAWLIQREALRREASELRHVTTDTIVLRDSVPVRVDIPAPLSRWQRWSMRTGNVVLRLSLLSIAGGAAWMIWKNLLRKAFRR